jgi:hypothetical protein
MNLILSESISLDNTFKGRRQPSAHGFCFFFRKLQNGCFSHGAAEKDDHFSGRQRDDDGPRSKEDDRGHHEKVPL